MLTNNIPCLPQKLHHNNNRDQSENVVDELQDLWPSTNNPCIPSGYICALSDSGSFWTAVQQPKITQMRVKRTASITLKMKSKLPQ